MTDHRSCIRNLCSCEKKAWKKLFLPQFKYMNFHIFTFISSPQRVYNEFTQWPAPSWLDSSVGRVLHRHRRGHGFESRSSLNFFQAFFSQLHKLRIQLRWSVIYSLFLPQFKYMNFHIFTFISSPQRVYNEFTQWPAPSWLDSSVGRALHRHRRGHGFESRSSLNFFRLSFRNCISCVYNCDDQSFIYCFFRSSNIWIFISSLSYFKECTQAITWNRQAEAAGQIICYNLINWIYNAIPEFWLTLSRTECQPFWFIYTMCKK